ncbi:hypothetical protein L484_015380 [Morus notabilis]|uniref:GST N-terminal domain-containing protein n=1 Tax=Morus notabilis TaxID=981085 RepID=W9S4U8_9ROSA|nr:hypothetical protein L484_015380 [Morus notabilis]
MAGALNLAHAPIFAPLISRRTTPNRLFSVRASSDGSSSSSSSSVTFAPPPNFKPPEPKRFGVRPDKAWDIVGAALALFFRFGTGVFASGYSVSFVPKDEFPPGQYALEVNGFKVKETSTLGPRPEKPIEIYEFEREIVAVLDLDVLYYPCPRNGPNFRPKAIQLGGKKQFPYMVDPNTGVSMYESDDIIKYLVGKYGDGKVPLTLSLGLLTTITAGLALVGRSGKGSTYSPAKLPPKPLEIWAYEGSPFCKYVREALVELELPHIQRSCARGSAKRQILYDKVGHFQVPYLQDPNTGVEMFESAEIVEYLRATYAVQ